MTNYSENDCYLKVVRPPTKTFKHFFTNKCQIERVSLLNDYDSLLYSIKHSKMLEQYKKKYPFNKPFLKEQVDEILYVKEMQDSPNKFYLTKILKQVHCYQYTIAYIQNKRRTKYDKNNQIHQQKLLRIWKNLKPSQQLKSRISDQWISIGFQVNDPATDFRGAGELGLINLYEFSSSTKCGLIFKVASSPDTQYFFCSAGLFMTMLAVEIMKLKVIQHHFWINQSQSQLLNNFQIVYETIFCQFSQYWLKQCKNKSIMYFNQNLKNFEKQVKKWNSFDLKGKIIRHKE